MGLLRSVLAPASVGEVAAVLAFAVLTSPTHPGNTNADSTSEQEEDTLPKRPVTLTDMPDEILLRIFHYLPQLDAARTPRETPKLRYLYINKRIYQMVRPKWYEHINLAFDKQGNDRNLMERLLWAIDVRPFVKSAKVTLSNSELAQEAVVISVLSNVRRLEVSIEPASWTNDIFSVPATHGEVLSGIPSRFPLLEEFRSSKYTITDDGVLKCFEKYRLPLRLTLFEVRLYDNRLVSRPFPRSPKLDITICLPDANPPQVGLHWHMLTHLKINTAFSEIWSKWMLTSVEAGVQGGRSLPLRFLDLPAMIYDKAAKVYATSINFAEKMLVALQSGELRHLRLHFGTLPWRSFGAILLEHLTTLTLEFECKVLDSQSFVDIVGSLVTSAPNLVVLSVDANDLVCANASEARAKTRLSEWDFARRHGHVHDLILLAQDSRILDFRTWRIRDVNARPAALRF
ncbi:hypothetical protein B0A53_02924 [Rhodotorula sp. CCFEE 5036]|nr:hypothetical protein B0A53_02924 [Rhodotorula sp. CCFEE 5036]